MIQKKLKDKKIPKSEAYFIESRPPQWVLNLKKGCYSMAELKEMTKLTPSAIAIQLIRYGAKRKIGRNDNNQPIYFYDWVGYKE